LSGRSEIGDRWDAEVVKDSPVERGNLSDFPVLNFDWEGLLEDPGIDVETLMTFEGLDAVAIEMSRRFRFCCLVSSTPLIPEALVKGFLQQPCFLPRELFETQILGTF
jgi:hypothetical protein